jgi:choline kinase
MIAIILAAGSGTRISKYTKNIPKGLLQINGKSVIQRQIDLFKKKKINEIIIITGPHKNFGIQDVSYINDKEHLNHDVLGSLMVARDSIKGEIITSYSDIIFDEKILDQILNFKGDIGIPIDLDWEKHYEGRTEHPKLEADNVILKDKKIIKIQKNITTKNKDEIVGEFLGPIIFSKKGSEIFMEHYKKIEKTHKKEFHNAPSLEKAYLTDMIQELIDNDVKITPIFINGKWYEIDTPQDLEIVAKLFRQDS